MNVIRETRLKRGLTIAELARRARCSRVTVYAAERDDHRLSLDAAIRIADALDIDVRLLWREHADE